MNDIRKHLSADFIASGDVEELLAVMARLRDPETGCAWDVEQSFASIAAYTIEEAYEVADAIERGNRHDLKDELGDLLLQVVFHARIAQEEGSFEFSDVVCAIVDKMIRRHPHVFGVVGDSAAQPAYNSTKELKAAWEKQKAEERKARPQDPNDSSEIISELDGIAANLPALSRAQKIQKRASRVGFDWKETLPVMDKVVEELQEIKEALPGKDQQAIEDEVGDLLFTAVNLARHCEVNPESALRRANEKFSQRFRLMEQQLAGEGTSLSVLTDSEREEAWGEAKRLLERENVPQ